MKYETGLEFGKNAAIINEAYCKMNEASNAPTASELADELAHSGKHEEYIRNFNPEKEYEEYKKSERLQRKKEREETENMETQNVNASEFEDDEDEDSQNFMSSFKGGINRTSAQSNSDFLLDTHSDLLRSKFPSWVIESAKKAVLNGQSLPPSILNELVGWMKGVIEKCNKENTEVPAGILKAMDTVNSSSTADTSSTKGVSQKPRTLSLSIDGVEDVEDETESDVDGNDSPEENFYINVIEANPDVFNDDTYDMSALASHKKEIHDKAVELLMMGYDEIQATEKALESIDGCDFKEQSYSQSDDGLDDFLGNLDD